MGLRNQPNWAAPHGPILHVVLVADNGALVAVLRCPIDTLLVDAHRGGPDVVGGRRLPLTGCRHRVPKKLPSTAVTTTSKGGSRGVWRPVSVASMHISAGAEHALATLRFGRVSKVFAARLHSRADNRAV